jgi:rubrerythrin
MSKEDDRTRIVDEEEWNEFQEYQAWKRARKKAPKEEEKPAEKKKAWYCAECGQRLGPGELTAEQLTRQHPDGCPSCGATRALIE